MTTHKCLSRLLRKFMADEKDLVSVEELARNIDLSDIPREVLEKAYLDAIARKVLYDHGFRAVDRGSGMYFNTRTENQALLYASAKRAEMDAKSHKAVAVSLKNLSQRGTER